jgi:hypothetical protein
MFFAFILTKKKIKVETRFYFRIDFMVLDKFRGILN